VRWFVFFTCKDIDRLNSVYDVTVRRRNGGKLAEAEKGRVHLTVEDGGS